MSGIERILDFSQEPAYVRAEGGLLAVEAKEHPTVKMPMGEVAAVILAHPQVTITRGALGGLAAAGAVVVICDESFMPISMAMPLTGFHAPARRMAAQVAAALPVKKRLWQQVVRAKVSAQAALLEQELEDDFGLRLLADEVRSGDTENVEGQAARIYWQSIFKDGDFLRRTDVPNQNRYLNYAYAVVRAVTARAICAAGLHPGLGIHHHHRENAFCLADDLMEPFRPAADEAVLDVWRENGPDAQMGKVIKAKLIEVVNARFRMRGEQRVLFDAVSRLATSVGLVFEEREQEAALPEF